MLLDQNVLLHKVKEVLAQVINDDIKEKDLRLEASLINDLAIDSLRIVELSLLLEQAFNQTIFLPDWLTSEKGPEDLTIGSLVKYLGERLNA